jgi:purine-nucleoside phosphorylase
MWRKKMTNNLEYKLEGKIYNRQDVNQIASAILERCPDDPPEIGMVLGSGFASFADEIENAVHIPYDDLPLQLFPKLNTPSHISELVIGDLAGKRVVCAKGKVFLFDGAPAQISALTVRLYYTLGCRKLFYTNTAGAVDPSIRVGEFAILQNHINLTGRNPLVGESKEEWGSGFFDMTYPYDKEYINIAKEVSKHHDIPLHDAIFGCMLGPCYETAAEIHMLNVIGANIVGQSTIPEVIAARQLDMRVIVFGFISNMAAGVSDTTLEDEDIAKKDIVAENILEMTAAYSADYAKLARGIISRM